ncbi:MAG: ABC transporter substrate binding protein [Sideroxydans sp.]|nr:ABC transporter substrate binding protein [Sideroxydans sp.]
MICRSIFLTLFSFVCLCATASATNELRITLVLSEDTPLYKSFSESLSQNLSNQFKIEVLTRSEDFRIDAHAPDLIITVGSKAANSIVEKSNIPVLATLISLDQYTELSRQRPHDSNLAAIYLNQPLGRQIHLFRAALPKHTKIGLLYSSDSRLDIRNMQIAFAQQGIELVAKRSSMDSLYEDLSSIINSSEVVLAIPDNKIYNSNTLRNILLQSYQHAIPLVGYSQSLVKAGALCAAYSSPEQIAAQANEIVSQFAKTRKLPAPQYPQFFSIAVNQDVAKSLGITLPSAELLKVRIDKMQGGRP